MTLELARHPSPIGEMTLAFHNGTLCALAFSDRWAAAERALARRFATPARVTADARAVTRLLDAYFAGECGALDAIAVDTGGSAFQQAVWAALRRIPVGSTTSYGELARAIGAPTAVRAVGAANGANPISLIVPCHRVIGADGRLVGYGGGLDRKRWLLAHEGALARQPVLAFGGILDRERAAIASPGE
jgi:methylated-DNA-[protein]-cysteine S-methyltransferase